MSVNKVILVGNVGKDPEVKFIESGVAVAKFPLATTEVYNDKNNQKKEITEWHNIVLWRGLAEIAQKYVKKGKQVYIEGKISTRSYEKDGQKLYFTEIIGQTMQLLGKKDDGPASSGGPENQSPQNTNTSTPDIELTSDNTKSDLPF
ncbi:MAG: single-stranded DNA-binding protein [Bacteroidetes bacterium HGW-Bacteroidetes-21]|nr:MAG: single-stranded DNA-binding protein [Bacteroidetes bacterium HGW-Bacteroidetes-21]